MVKSLFFNSEPEIQSPELPAASPHGARHACHVGHQAPATHGAQQLGGHGPGGFLRAAEGGTEGDEILIFFETFSGFFMGKYMILLL